MVQINKTKYLDSIFPVDLTNEEGIVNFTKLGYVFYTDLVTIVLL